MTVAWPEAALTPLARARALAAAIPGAGYREATFDAPYATAWARLSDLERSVPAADKAVRRIRVKERRRLADGAEELRFTTTSPLGLFTPFTARLEDGFCLMRAKGRIYVVVMAAEPTDDGRTRFGQIEAVPRRWGWILKPLMRLTVGDDIKGFRRYVERP
jgi:hypothetical protein